MQPHSRQLIGLDLIRFAAACMVVAYHLGNVGTLKAWTWWGWVGVPIFFVLSGFVISYSAERASAGEFLRNRIVRLAPGIWICATVTALGWLIVGGEPQLGRRYLGTLVLWPLGPWIDGVYWTLPIEIVFYAAVFGVLWLGAIKRMSVLFYCISLASLAYWGSLIILQLSPNAHIFAWPRALGQIANLTLIPHGCYFALGGSFWIILRGGLNGDQRRLLSSPSVEGYCRPLSFAARQASHPPLFSSKQFG